MKTLGHYIFTLCAWHFFRLCSKKLQKKYFALLCSETWGKITWVLRVVRDLEQVPVRYLKKLVSTDNIWEVRVDVGRNTFRLFGFFNRQELIVLTN